MWFPASHLLLRGYREANLRQVRFPGGVQVLESPFASVKHKQTFPDPQGPETQESSVEKIVDNPVVELDGDEMTRIIWQLSRIV